MERLARNGRSKAAIGPPWRLPFPPCARKGASFVFAGQRACRNSSGRGRGGTGRRARFRSWYRKMWGFESLRPHQFPTIVGRLGPRKVCLEGFAMQIVETTNEGLKRAYTVKIPAKEIEARIDAEVKKVAPQVRMPGFRPGKVPANLIRKMHGPALHSDAFNASVRESIDTLMREKKLRPALQPKVDLKPNYEEGKDAELTVEVEVLPEIEAPSVDGLKLERLTVPVTDAALDEALQRLA